MKQQRIIFKLVICLAFCFFFSKLGITAMAQETTCQSSIESFVSSINDNDWDSFKNYVTIEEQAFYNWYFNEDSYTDGLKQIQSIKLNNVFPLNNSQIENELLYDSYPILLSEEPLYSYLVELDCNVTEDTVYFHNGVNYYLIVFAKDIDNTYKIAQFNQPSYSLLQEIIMPTLKDRTSSNDERIAAMEIINHAEHGVLIDNNGKVILDENYTIFRKDKETGIVENYSELLKNDSLTRSNNYIYHPALNHYSYYTIPSRITVWLNQTSSAVTMSVPLNNYVKNTLPNEIYADWNQQAIKANAYCVKGVGIYRSIKPISTSYMVNQTTQKYIPQTEVDTINAIVDTISNKYMVNSDYKIFYPEYGAGTKGSTGNSGTARLLQWGSQYLANSLNYSYNQILDYYYAQSDCSAGSIKYVSC